MVTHYTMYSDDALVHIVRTSLPTWSLKHADSKALALIEELADRLDSANEPVERLTEEAEKFEFALGRVADTLNEGIVKSEDEDHDGLACICLQDTIFAALEIIKGHTE